MVTLTIEDHIIGIAEILKVTEKEVMWVIVHAFEHTSNTNNEILDEAYRTFQKENNDKNN